MRSHLEPLRVCPEKCLPADSLLPGLMATTHDARRPEGPNWLMSGPISAKITSAERRLTPGLCRRKSISPAKGAIIAATSLLSRPMDSSRYSRCASNVSKPHLRQQPQKSRPEEPHHEESEVRARAATV